MSRRVLLVSDSLSDRWPKLVQEVLKDLDIVVVADRSGRNQRGSSDDFSAIILDANSLGNTEELVRLLRSQSSHVPIVVATSSLSWECARGFLRAGANGYILQTFDREKLADSLSKALRETSSVRPTEV